MQAAYRRMMRFRAGCRLAGLPAGPYLVLQCEAVVNFSFITHNRTTVEPTLELSIVRPTRRYSTGMTTDVYPRENARTTRLAKLEAA